MTHYDVYLEINTSGQCMAHVLALPGCFVRANSEEAALTMLPETIRGYFAWLQGHGETAEIPSYITLNIAERQEAIGSFVHGDVAALFEAEKRPLSREELERFLELAAYNREDLLKLARPLPKSIRHWQPEPDQMPIERILRHIGKAKKWYVSRLVEPDSLPPEWANDGEMPIFRFLTMEHKTAVARLRQLSDNELGHLVHPAHNTNAPGEPWTACKVLRRFLEHEQEHTKHIQEVLTAWRSHLLARLAAERHHFFRQLYGLSAETLSTMPVRDGWTAKDLLAHVAVWDAFQADRMSLVINGRIQDIHPVGGDEGMAVRNTELYQQFKNAPLEQAVAMALKERSGFLATLDRIPDPDLHHKITMPWGWRTTMRRWAEWRYTHDAEHAIELEKWRKQQPRAIGPKFLLRALLQVARKEWLTTAALVPTAEREIRPVCGIWTLRDLVSHLTDWELVGVEALRQLAAGHTPEFDQDIMDFDVFNNANAAARQGQSWEQVWNDFQQTRQVFLHLFDSLPEEALAREFIAPWRRPITLYRWVAIWPGHEAEHALDVRRAMGVKWPKRLSH